MSPPQVLRRRLGWPSLIGTDVSVIVGFELVDAAVGPVLVVVLDVFDE
jgi:hypothetical protein